MRLGYLHAVISSLLPKVPIHTEEEEKEREKKIVARYARGNISLQLGRYITTKDVEKRIDHLASYKF